MIKKINGLTRAASKVYDAIVRGRSNRYAPLERSLSKLHSCGSAIQDAARRLHLATQGQVGSANPTDRVYGAPKDMPALGDGTLAQRGAGEMGISPQPQDRRQVCNLDYLFHLYGAAVTGKPFRIVNIRAGRKKPGMGHPSAESMKACPRQPPWACPRPPRLRPSGG